MGRDDKDRKASAQGLIDLANEEITQLSTTLAISQDWINAFDTATEALDAIQPSIQLADERPKLDQLKARAATEQTPLDPVANPVQ